MHLFLFRWEGIIHLASFLFTLLKISVIGNWLLRIDFSYWSECWSRCNIISLFLTFFFSYQRIEFSYWPESSSHCLKSFLLIFYRSNFKFWNNVLFVASIIVYRNQFQTLLDGLWMEDLETRKINHCSGMLNYYWNTLIRQLKIVQHAAFMSRSAFGTYK